MRVNSGRYCEVAGVERVDILSDMFRRGSQSKYRLMYHLVWIPKYRKRILKGVLKSRLEFLFRQCAKMNDWQIEELNVQPDYVHLLIQIKSTIIERWE